MCEKANVIYVSKVHKLWEKELKWPEISGGGNELSTYPFGEI